jgi:hypothetical protein
MNETESGVKYGVLTLFQQAGKRDVTFSVRHMRSKFVSRVVYLSKTIPLVTLSIIGRGLSP